MRAEGASDDRGWLGILVPALPLAAAIGVFGTVYGAAAGPLVGAPMTLATSLLVFSGALQFAVIGLVAAGAGPPAILLTAVVLNMRHVVLGALLRPRLGGSAARRAGLAWFLVDESFGLAYAARRNPAATLFVVGVACYVGWQLGTALGLLGAQLTEIQGVAAALFPVLFIGLAAVTSTRLAMALRAAIAGCIVLAVAWFAPDLRAFAPVLVALAVAVPGGSGRER